MNVMVNGDAVDLDVGITLAALVDTVVPNPRGIAVAVNEEVVPRSTWRDLELRPDDRIEILQASRGG